MNRGEVMDYITQNMLEWFTSKGYDFESTKCTDGKSYMVSLDKDDRHHIFIGTSYDDAVTRAFNYLQPYEEWTDTVLKKRLEVIEKEGGNLFSVPDDHHGIEWVIKFRDGVTFRNRQRAAVISAAFHSLPKKSKPAVALADDPNEERVTNESGGMQSKLDVDLTYLDQIFLHETARVMTEASDENGGHYPRNNWRLIDSDDHLRHLIAHVIRLSELRDNVREAKDNERAYEFARAYREEVAHVNCRAMMLTRKLFDEGWWTL